MTGPVGMTGAGGRLDAVLVFSQTRDAVTSRRRFVKAPFDRLRLMNITPSQESSSIASRSLGGETMREHRGSLRSKLVLAVAAMFFVLLAIDEVVRRRIVEPEFAALERLGAARDASRVFAAICSEIDHFQILASQLAHDLDLHWGADSVDTSRFDRLPADMSQSIAVVFADGHWRWLRKSASSAEPLESQIEPLVDGCIRADRHKASGITRAPDNTLLMFASAPVDTMPLDQPRADVKTDGSYSDGNPPTHLVVLQPMDGDLIAALRTQTQVSFTIESRRSDRPTSGLSIRATDASTLIAEVPLTCPQGKPLASLRLRIPRDITSRATTTNVLARNTFLICAAAALILFLLILQWLVIRPLVAIRRHTEHVAEHGLQTDPLLLSRNDELGELALAFDNMVQCLADTQQCLTQTSRAAGMAQVADTVIHNIGNVLTNINSLVAAASERLGQMRLSPLKQLSDRLRDSDADEEIITATPAYLNALHDSLKRDQDHVLESLRTLDSNVRHIHDVIRDQQCHTRTLSQTQRFIIRDLIDDAIDCCRARLEQDSVRVEIIGEGGTTVSSDRSLLLQVMINLIGNARQAMQDQPRSERTLTIEIISGLSSVQVHLRDTGRGMSPEIQQRAFRPHFTTRANGSGLGLHFCAFTLKRLGGGVTASSDGLGTGATFAMEIPIASPAEMPTTANDLPSLVDPPSVLDASDGCEMLQTSGFQRISVPPPTTSETAP